MLDPFGDHALHCRSNGRRNIRHNRLRDEVARCIRPAGFATRREQLVYDSANKRPADVRVLSWTPEEDGWLDVTVVNPFARSRLDQELKVPAGAVDKAERDKRDDTEEAAKAKGAVYLPLALRWMVV